MTTQFQVGETYATRSIGDYDMVLAFTILARTAKTITTTVMGKTVRRGVYVYDDVEQFRPYGTYSMCAIVGADKRKQDIACEEVKRECFHLIWRAAYKHDHGYTA